MSTSGDAPAAVNDAHRLADQVAARLSAHHGTDVSVREAHALNSGNDAHVIKVRFAGRTTRPELARPLVLRSLPIDRHQSALWEQRVHAHLRAHGLHVPEVLTVVPLDERSVQVMELLQGRTAAAEMAARPWSTPACVRLLAASLAAVHAVPTAGFPAHPTTEELVDRRLAPVLALSLQDGVGPDLREMAVEARLRVLAAVDVDGLVVVHGDFHPLNALVHAGGMGLVDWTDAGLAPPEADIARLETALELAAVGAPSVAERAAVSLIRKRFPRRVSHLYQETSGRRLAAPAINAWKRVHLLHDFARVVGAPLELPRRDEVHRHLQERLGQVASEA